MRVLFLTRFGCKGASSRLRAYQFFPWLGAQLMEVDASPLFSDEMLVKKYHHGSYSFFGLIATFFLRMRLLLKSYQYDLLWIEKEALPWMPAWLEHLLLRKTPYVLDFDDAIFHNYDLHPFSLIRFLYGRRIDYLMKNARLIVAGNSYLAKRAHLAAAKWVEILPTVIDLFRYSQKPNYSYVSKPRIVWIGSPSTVRYLLDLAKPLAELNMQWPFVLRVIGSSEIKMSGVDIELLGWTLDTENQLLVESDIGIMPLQDTPWEHGKCAYKLIQYMACGLPTVASPIGANKDITIPNQTGLFASSDDEWVRALLVLLSDETLRQKLGQAGRIRVEKEYSLQSIAPRLANLLIQAGRP